jgi:hypothetical protein
MYQLRRSTYFSLALIKVKYKARMLAINIRHECAMFGFKCQLANIEVSYQCRQIARRATRPISRFIYTCKLKRMSAAQLEAELERLGGLS